MTPSKSSRIKSLGKSGTPFRLAAIAPMLEFSRLARLRSKSISPQAEHLNGTMSAIAARCARRTRVSVRTIWRWYHKFTLGGYTALAHERSDIGRSRFLVHHPEALRIIEDLSFDEHDFTPREIWRRLKTSLGVSTPSYTTVRCLVNAFREQQGAR